MNNQLAEPLFIQIRRKRYQIASLQQASQMFEKARDASGLGASRMPPALIVRADGTSVGYVSYNGRVWAGSPTDSYDPARVPLYDNRMPLGEVLCGEADARGMPRRTLEQVKAGLAQAKKTRADISMARLMLKFGRMTDDAREYVRAYHDGR